MTPYRRARSLLLGMALIFGACTVTPTMSEGPAVTAAPSNVALSDCPNPPQGLATIIALSPSDRLACFGGGSVSFAAVVGMPITDCGMGLRIDPAGLCLPGVLLLSSAAPSSAGLPAYWNTASGLKATVLPAERGASVQVTGHFDDPTAQMCHLSGAPSGGPTMEPTDIVLACREAFIIDAIR